MPGMPRLPGKSQKIAYKILGVPANMSTKKSPKQLEMDKRLTYQDTARSK